MRVFLCSIVAILGGCTSTGNSDAGPVEPPNTPPTIELGELVVGQGQSKSFELSVVDAENDAVTLTVDSPGLEASVDTKLALHAGYDATGPVDITLHASDARGAKSDATHAVEVKPIGWRSATSWTGEGPEAREHGAMFLDEAGRSIVLLGGSGYQPYLEPLGDAWRYDLAAQSWSPVTPSGDALPPGGSRRAAIVPGTTTAYLFGGYGDGNIVYQDLYKVDYASGGLAITTVEQVGPPPARALHGFVYDPTTERFYAFGGFSGSGILDDTWSMELVDGVAHWTLLDLPVRPSKRYGFFYGFDADAGRLIVYCGAQGLSSVDPANDTWALDVRSDPPTWELVADDTASPPGRRNGCHVFDPGGPRLWVFGGTPDAMTTSPGLWAFDARVGHEAWSEVPLTDEPPLRSSGFGVYDPVTQQVLLGFGNSSSGIYRDLHALGY